MVRSGPRAGTIHTCCCSSIYSCGGTLIPAARSCWFKLSTPWGGSDSPLCLTTFPIGERVVVYLSRTLVPLLQIQPGRLSRLLILSCSAITNMQRTQTQAGEVPLLPAGRASTAGGTNAHGQLHGGPRRSVSREEQAPELPATAGNDLFHWLS